MVKKDSVKKLHIYPQEDLNDSVEVMGTTQGLEALRDAINEALEWSNQSGEAQVKASDGEKYDIRVIQLNLPGTLKILPLPYTHPFNTAMWEHYWDSAKKIPSEIWNNIKNQD